MSVIEYKIPSLSLYVHEHHIVAKANPLVKISEKELKMLDVVAKKHFHDPFGLIEIRDKYISIEPELHARVKELLPFFAAYALVTDSVRTVKNLYKEKPFMGYENFRLCSTISEATDWVKFVLERNYPETKPA